MSNNTKNFLSPDSLVALLEFDQNANKANRIHLQGHDEERWEKFVVTSHLNNDTIDEEELRRWFLAKGWDEDVVDKLISRCVDGLTLLKTYDQMKG